VNDVQLIVDDPHVLGRIVGAHLDLVRSASALHVEELVVLWPVLHLLAVPIDNEDHVMVATLPATLFRGLARGAEPVVVAGGVAA
jgi:hypothetical protein